MKDKSETGTDHNDCDGGGGRRMHQGSVGVDSMSLARRIADMAQHLTQRLGGRYGRMLSVSFGGSFPRGRGGGEAEGASAGVVGKKNAPSQIDTFLRGCGFYELFLV